MVAEVVGVGRAGSLVDWESAGENRVYATLYRAETILNWRTQRLAGRNVLTLLVLAEKAEGLGAGALAAGWQAIIAGQRNQAPCPAPVCGGVRPRRGTAVWRRSPHRDGPKMS